MTLLQSFNIAKSGLDTASTRLTNHSTNIANAATPYYKRKIPVVSESNMVSFQGVLEDMRNNLFRTGLTFQSNGASYEGFVEDPTPGQIMQIVANGLKYLPGHFHGTQLPCAGAYEQGNKFCIGERCLAF